MGERKRGRERERREGGSGERVGVERGWEWREGGRKEKREGERGERKEKREGEREREGGSERERKREERERECIQHFLYMTLQHLLKTEMNGVLGHHAAL